MFCGFLRGRNERYHSLYELSGDDDVGELLHVIIRSRVKGGTHVGLPRWRCWCCLHLEYGRTIRSLFVHGKQIQHAEGRAVRSIECNVRVTIWALVPLALGIEHVDCGFCLLGSVGDLILKRATSYVLGFAGSMLVPRLVKILPRGLHTFARPKPVSFASSHRNAYCRSSVSQQALFPRVP